MQALRLAMTIAEQLPEHGRGGAMVSYSARSTRTCRRPFHVDSYTLVTISPRPQVSHEPLTTAR